jgi:hypothetical protein
MAFSPWRVVKLRSTILLGAPLGAGMRVGEPTGKYIKKSFFCQDAPIGEYPSTKAQRRVNNINIQIAETPAASVALNYCMA